MPVKYFTLTKFPYRNEEEEWEMFCYVCMTCMDFCTMRLKRIFDYIQYLTWIISRANTFAFFVKLTIKILWNARKREWNYLPQTAARSLRLYAVYKLRFFSHAIWEYSNLSKAVYEMRIQNLRRCYTPSRVKNVDDYPVNFSFARNTWPLI